MELDRIPLGILCDIQPVLLCTTHIYLDTENMLKMKYPSKMQSFCPPGRDVVSNKNQLEYESHTNMENLDKRMMALVVA